MVQTGQLELFTNYELLVIRKDPIRNVSFHQGNIIKLVLLDTSINLLES
jgi:hypothetical protein